MTNTVVVKMLKLTGTFAENKDVATAIRKERIAPALDKKKEVILDFHGVEAATQSFIHALISQLIRDYGIKVLKTMAFKDCTASVQKVIEIVVDYMQTVDA